MDQTSSDLVKNAAASLQAQERLHLSIVQDEEKKDYVTRSSEILENLRLLKSQLEGSACPDVEIRVEERFLTLLRHHTLKHIPSSLDVETRQSITDLVTKELKGQCERVIFIGLVTCPWHAAMQKDRGIQAKHNAIVALFVSKNSQILSPINPHEQHKAQLIDKGWFIACEVQHFAEHLMRGKVRCVEWLSLPESAIIHQTAEWRQLCQDISISKLLRMTPFIAQCRGQAVGSVGHKAKSGKMKINDTATLYEFCTSFRLLQHVEQALANCGRLLDTVSETNLSPVGVQALQAIQSVYQEEGGPTREDLFGIVMRWQEELEAKMTNFKTSKSSKHAEEVVNKWLWSIRLQGHQPRSINTSLKTDDETVLRHLLEEIGNPISKMSPENIVLVARAGSHLYGLSTPQSDVDFIVVYTEPLENVFSCKQVKECVESRGPQKVVEYGAYEARLFCEMVMKGSIVISELLFVDEVDYASPAWKKLLEGRRHFLTEHLILQYFGLIKNNMHKIVTDIYKDQPRERKLFYQIFHKAHAIECLLKGQCPEVRCRGELRDFIMHIRKDDQLEGEFSRLELIKKAQVEIDTLKTQLCDRQTRLAEVPNFKFLSDWLMQLRGVPMR